MIGFSVQPIARRVSRGYVEKFRALPVANVSDCMSRLTGGGPRLRPYHAGGGLSGPAFTVKTRPGDNLMVHKALDIASPGDVVVLDNLGSHKGKAARAIVRAKGAHLIFLPPYSPDLNPIEQVFAKLKHLVRKAQPRDVETTWRKVGQLLDLFSPAECANYLVNSGYGSV